MVLSIETGIKDPEAGFIKLEDTVIVTKSGWEDRNMPDKSGIDKTYNDRTGSPHRWLTSVGIGWRGRSGDTKQCFSDEANSDRMRLN
jgi:Xaa-Pro aminopeptidase